MIDEFEIPVLAPGTMVACLHRAGLPCGCGIWIGRDLSDDLSSATVTVICSDDHEAFGNYLFKTLMIARENPVFHDRDAIEVAEIVLENALYGFPRRN